MPTIDQLNAALVKADANGDTQNAQVFANQIKQMRSAGGDAPPAPAGTPQDRANVAGQQAGAGESPLEAGIGQAAQQGTFGLQNYINAGARYAAQRISGVQNPDDFSTDVAYARGKSQGEATGHPVASTIGGVLGTVLGAGAAVKAVRAIPGAGAIADLVTPKAGPGNVIGNVTKSALANGAIGAGTSAAEGDDVPTVGRNAAISAVAGPIVGKAATVAANKIEPLASAALSKLVPSFNPDKLSATSLASMNALATQLGVNGKDLQAAYDSHVKLTGSLPSLAQVTDIAQQGKLKALAAANPEIGEAAMTAAAAGNAPLHVQLQQAASDRANLAAQGMNGRPQTSQGLLAARDTAMDAMMNSKGPSGLALRDEPVSDPTGVLNQPHVAYALQPDTQLNARLGQASPVLDNIRNGNVTIGDVDTVRKALRGTQADLMRPNPSGGSAQNPLGAKEFGNVAQQVEGLGTGQHADYGTALNGYRQISRYETGFNHGLNGNAITEAPDDFTAKDLATGMGKAGYAHGNALMRAQAALDAIAPASVKSGNEPDLGTAATIAHTAAVPTIGTVAALANHLTGLKLPTNVAKVAAQQLFSNDPVVVKQGIANMNRAGVSSDEIRKLGAAIGGTAAAGINAFVNGR